MITPIQTKTKIPATLITIAITITNILICSNLSNNSLKVLEISKIINRKPYKTNSMMRTQLTNTQIKSHNTLKDNFNSSLLSMNNNNPLSTNTRSSNPNSSFRSITLIG